MKRVIQTLLLLVVAPRFGSAQLTAKPIPSATTAAAGQAAIKNQAEPDSVPGENKPAEFTSVPPNGITTPQQVVAAAKTVSVGGLLGAKATLCLGPSWGGCPSAGGAKKRVEKSLRKWGRFTLVEDQTKADLVLVVVEGMGRPRLLNGPGTPWATLQVFQGPGPVAEGADPLWKASATPSLLWNFPPTEQLVKELRKDVEQGQNSRISTGP